jgi:hypothetical protein
MILVCADATLSAAFQPPNLGDWLAARRGMSSGQETETALSTPRFITTFC